MGWVLKLVLVLTSDTNMTICVEGGDWKREIELDDDIEKSHMYMEAATRAVEQEYSENDEFEIGIIIKAYLEENETKDELHVMLLSHTVLVNAGLFNTAESMRQFFMDAEGIDVSACSKKKPTRSKTNPKKKKKS